MPALQNFFNAERIRRGWSVRELAERSRISVSKAYAIANGDDNVETETFENIAAAFSLTPAELMVAIGKGADLTPDEVEHISLYRLVPRELRPATTSMLRGLVGPFTGAKEHSKRRAINGRPKHSTKLNNPEAGPDDILPPWYARLQRQIATSPAGL